MSQYLCFRCAECGEILKSDVGAMLQAAAAILGAVDEEGNSIGVLRCDPCNQKPITEETLQQFPPERPKEVSRVVVPSPAPMRKGN